MLVFMFMYMQSSNNLVFYMYLCRKPAADVVVPKAAVAPPVSALPSSSANIAIEGLAHVGARAALSFAFAFLRRAWRLGEDSELCEQVISITSSFLYISYDGLTHYIIMICHHFF